MKRNFIILFVSIAALLTACVGESPTVIPDPAKQAFTGSDTGTSSPQLTGTYPENLDTDIPVDADIVMVFSKPMDAGTFIPANVTITDGVTPVTAFGVSTASDGRAIIIDVTTPANLTYGAFYTVSITTGIKADIAVGGLPLEAGTSWTFTAASDTALLEAPRVISGTQYPTGATVPVNTSYAEVTFTRDMNPVTIDLASFSSDSGIDDSIIQITPKTFRLKFDPLDKLDYGIMYQVDLTNTILDTGGTALTPFSWTFTTEADPDTAPPLAISSVWIESVSDTGAVVSFTTNRPVAQNTCYALHSTSSPVLVGSTAVPESGLTTLSTVHTVTIAGLTQSTLYYIRAGVNTAGGVPPVEVLSATELSIYTKTAVGVGVNEPATTAAGIQNGLVTVQNSNGTGYAFWVDSGADIYGKYFRSIAKPAGQWGPGGTQINSTANMTKVIAISNGFSDAIAVFRRNTNALYARAVYDNAGAFAALWAEQNLGLTTKANSSFSACLVHERPSTIASGIADMPDDGAAANLLFDKGRDFSSIAFLDAGDMLAVDDATISWTNGAIENQGASPYDVFKYVLKSSAAVPGLAALTNYYVLDADTVISGTADSTSTDVQLRSSVTNLLPVSTGDIIVTGDDEWGIADSDGAWDIGGWWYVDIDRSLTNFADGKAFTIYTTYSGPHNSQAVINPFWDNNPPTLFNPGTTVLEDDYVINMTSSPAKASTVAPIVAAEDSNYALQLDAANIMFNAQNYTIRRLPASATYKTVGINTIPITTHSLVDSTNPFAVSMVSDIVMNLTSGNSAMITGFTNASTVSLSSDIFTATGQRYIVYTKRSYLVAYIDTNDFVLARSFNYATGAAISAVFPVQTAGVNSNPVAVSDGAGNAIIFYERGGTIYARKVSATGAMLWAGEATILAGFTIVQALPDRAITGTGGAYLLTENGAGTIRILRVNSTGGITFNLNFPGYDPHMATDTITGTPDRVIIAYRVPHTVVASIYYHIEARAYTGAGALTGPVVVSISTATYHCEMPRVALADTGAGTSAFYVSWFDGRYIAYIGYSLFAMRYDAAGVVDGTFNTGIEKFITSPGSAGYLNELLVHLLFWDDDGVSPYGIIPIWLDYRAALPVNQPDIYYENIADDGSF